MSNNTKRYRTHQERIKAIFTFMEGQPDVFPKSRLKEIGLNPRTAEVWLKLIEFIQNQPRIRLIQSDHNLLVEKVEGKYQALMRKMSLNEKAPFEQRQQFLTDYLKTLYIREKTKNIEISYPHPNIIKDNQSDPHEIIIKTVEALSTLSLIDPRFNQYIHPLNNLGSNPTTEEEFIAIGKWQKEVILDKDFESMFNRVGNKDFYSSQIRKITKKKPNFMKKLKQAERTIQAHYSFLRETMADWFFK